MLNTQPHAAFPLPRLFPGGTFNNGLISGPLQVTCKAQALQRLPSGADSVDQGSCRKLSNSEEKYDAKCFS